MHAALLGGSGGSTGGCLDWGDEATLARIDLGQIDYAPVLEKGAAPKTAIGTAGARRARVNHREQEAYLARNPFPAVAVPDVLFRPTTFVALANASLGIIYFKPTKTAGTSIWRGWLEPELCPLRHHHSHGAHAAAAAGADAGGVEQGAPAAVAAVHEASAGAGASSAMDVASADAGAAAAGAGAGEVAAVGEPAAGAERAAAAEAGSGAGGAGGGGAGGGGAGGRRLAVADPADAAAAAAHGDIAAPAAQGADAGAGAGAAGTAASPPAADAAAGAGRGHQPAVHASGKLVITSQSGGSKHDRSCVAGRALHNFNATAVLEQGDTWAHMWSDSLVFASVRHPLHRARSSYAYLLPKVKRALGALDVDVGWEQFCADPTIFARACHSCLQLYTRAECGCKVGVLMEHVAPQTNEFAGEGAAAGALNLDRVVRVEAIEADLPELCEQLNGRFAAAGEHARLSCHVHHLQVSVQHAPLADAYSGTAAHCLAGVLRYYCHDFVALGATFVLSDGSTARVCPSWCDAQV